MSKTEFFISGTCADCFAFFKEENALLSFSYIVNLLTKSAVYKLYISETFEEAKALGECIYKFKIPTDVLENRLFQYAEKQNALSVPVNRIQ
ncbi:hypothetical protein [Virgibacillus halodenitrificans]|uniref:hypothetical protein n=1 Tax=Virgibacillus halodenitrificans TaxID=1482 RepID=UPI000EF46128|nr:hypothetical protein [Virgibacillus halodenitrificans]